MKIPFSPPFINQEVIDEVVDTLNSGWITTGPKTKQLERDIATFTDSKRSICFNSATSALMLGLKWYGIKKGDEVIIPAYTYCATALCVMHMGATPIMVDVGNDFNIDLEQVKNAITNKTKAIIPVDIGGMPSDNLGLLKIANEKATTFIPEGPEQEKLKRILILRDAAHSFGAIEQGKKVGSIADLTAFSFHAVKNVTSAEGGALCINLPDYEDIYKKLSLLSLNGQTKDALSKSQSNSWRYDIVLPGFKANMADLNASIALAQLKSYPEQIKRRKEIFDYYNSYFKEYNWFIEPPHNKGNSISSYHLFLLRINGISEVERDEIISSISNKGIGVNVHFVPLPLLSLFKNEFDISNYPVSYSQFENEISLPIYPSLTNKQLEYIVKTVIEIVNLFKMN